MARGLELSGSPVGLWANVREAAAALVVMGAAQPRSSIVAKRLYARATQFAQRPTGLPPPSSSANYAAFVTLLALRQRVQT